ncbi:MAG: hypothetical protein ACJA0N_001680 [Pseudohongiellaceae bacterium]
MVSIALYFKLSVLVVIMLLCGCVAQHRINALAQSLEVDGAESSLLELNEIKPSQRDRVQYLLNRGTLYRLNDRLAASTQDLETAKNIMRTLQATSLIESIGAVSINETVRSYAGTPSERVLVHTMLAFNYLQQGNLDGARVEMLQAGITMREVADGESLRGQLASSHYLTGLIYELNDEWDNAMISYRNTAKIFDQLNLAIPEALQISLLQTSYRQGLDQEYQVYVQRFSKQAKPFMAQEKELIVFYADGVVSHKKQHTISLYSYKLQQQIVFSVPYYAAKVYRESSFSLSIAGQYHSTDELESIDNLVRKDLENEMPGIIATATARVLAKYQMIEEMRKKEGDSMAALINLASAISEQADLRSWNMLPSSLQVARIRIPAGTDIESIALAGQVNSNELLNFNQGNTLLLIVNSIKH